MNIIGKRNIQKLIREVPITIYCFISTFIPISILLLILFFTSMIILILVLIIIYQIDALFKRIEICMNEKDVVEEKANIIENVKDEKKAEEDSVEIELEKEEEKEVEKEVEVSGRGRGPLKVRAHTLILS